ncbi:hypothetical protein [Nocardia aurea]|uniref:hypothetical protein n=1 Tax=Nocardia aurea TaxID=2144174 RepID=UPI0033A430DC
MNSVSATLSGERRRPWVRTRRTALIYDNTGNRGYGGDNGGGSTLRFDTAVTEFADLSLDPEPVSVGGRIYSPANLVAAVTNELIAASEPSAGVVTTYPAVYSDKQVALLRQALDLSGARDVLLVPEAVAAAEWLDRERGPFESGFILVYDLGANSLDVAVVRVGPDWPDHPIIGMPMRSHEFGGRPLGAIIARYARGATPDGLTTSIAPRDARDLRTAHIRKSFDLVRSCVRASGRTMADIDRILVVGGAARPAEVARTVAELGRPVVMSADPGQCCAAGAAHFAARVFAPADIGGHRTPKVGVFSSAAVASALAMSAATVFGGTGDQGMSPVLEILPGAETFADGLLYDPHGDSALDRVVRQGLPLAGTTAAPLGDGPGLAAFARTVPMGPSIAESGRASRPDPRSCCASLRDGRLYADPAHFVNPLPFNALNTARSVSGKPISWPDEREVPRVSLPGESTDASGTPRHSQTAPDPGAGSGAPSGADGSGASGGAGSGGGTASSGSGGAADSGGGEQNSGESGASGGSADDGDSSNGSHGSDGAGSGGAGSGGAGSGASDGSHSGGGASGDASSGGGGASGASGGGASGGNGGPGAAGSDSGGAGSRAPGGASGGSHSGGGASVGGSPGASSGGTAPGGATGGLGPGGSRPGTSAGAGNPGGGTSPGGPSSRSSVGGGPGGPSSSVGGSRGGPGGGSGGGSGGGMGGGGGARGR